MNPSSPLPGVPHQGPVPGVVFWYKAYCALMCFIYLALAAGSSVFFLMPHEKLGMAQTEAWVVGGVFLLLGLPLFGLFLAPFFMAFRSWVWGYAIGMMCIGMMSACFWPVCIPLLIYWFKPEVKARYGVRT